MLFVHLGSSPKGCESLRMVIMKNSYMKRIVSGLGVIVLAISSSQAGAAWNGEAVNLSSACLADSYNTVISCSNSTSGLVDVSGWSISPSGTTTFVSRSVKDWGTSNGLGVQYSGDEQHAIDNIEKTDLILLAFSERVSLSQITLGWSDYDGDFSLLAYGGSASTLSAIKDEFDNQTGLDNYVSKGWSLIGNYDAPGNIGFPDYDQPISTSTYSSYWLVSAYNSKFGGSLDGCDSFKVLKIAGTTEPTQETPEPGSMMLLGAGLFGMMALRRRQFVK